MNIYKEEILDHYKYPRNYGRLAEGIKAEEENKSCGDVIKMGVKIEKGKIEEVKFEGQGCAVSMAATSMLTEMLKGISLKKAEKINEADLLKTLGIRINLSRKKCATLGFKVWQKLLRQLI